MEKKTKKKFHKKLQEGSAALAIGTSLLLSSPEVTAAKPTLDSPKQTIQQRVARIREHLRQQTEANSAEQSNASLQTEEQLSQYPWPNWPNWSNWPNWRNW